MNGFSNRSRSSCNPQNYTGLVGWCPVGFPGGASGKELNCQCRRCNRCGFEALGWEDPLEESMAPHSSIFAWKIPWTEEPGGQQSIRLQRVGHDQRDLAHMSRYKLGSAYTVDLMSSIGSLCGKGSALHLAQSNSIRTLSTRQGGALEFMEPRLLLFWERSVHTNLALNKSRGFSIRKQTLRHWSGKFP